MSTLLSVQSLDAAHLTDVHKVATYSIFLSESGSTFQVDGTDYATDGAFALFLAPYQTLVWIQPPPTMKLIDFHGDFYCIEYHKHEVACNGLLFNNAYLTPFVTMDGNMLAYLDRLSGEMAAAQGQENKFSDSVVKSYLQLILALCSRAKSTQEGETLAHGDADTEAFRRLLEAHHAQERSAAFYAQRLQLSPDALNKKLKAQYGKTTSQLVQDRVVISAKRLLHLTRKSIKEIAAELNFDDEFYFSRYFKKATDLSPKHFREKVGISIVADLSMQ